MAKRPEPEIIRVVNTSGSKLREREITRAAWDRMQPSQRAGWFVSDEPLSDLQDKASVEKAGLEDENAQLRKRIAILDKELKAKKQVAETEEVAPIADVEIEAPQAPQAKQTAPKKKTAKKK